MRHPPRARRSRTEPTTYRLCGTCGQPPLPDAERCPNCGTPTTVPAAPPGRAESRRERNAAHSQNLVLGTLVVILIVFAGLLVAVSAGGSNDSTPTTTTPATSPATPSTEAPPTSPPQTSPPTTQPAEPTPTT
jgi:hypothetical protein